MFRLTPFICLKAANDINLTEQRFAAKKDRLELQLIIFQHLGPEIYLHNLYMHHSLISLQ